MRLYRCDEKAIVGIHLTTTPDGLCIEVGDKQVPIDKGFEQSLITARDEVIRRLREYRIARKYRELDLTDEDVNKIDDMIKTIEVESISAVYADVEGKKIIKQRKGRGRQMGYLDALGLVETASGPNGTISFKSTTHDEYVDTRSSRVKRKYRNIFPPPGIHIIEEGKTTQGGQCFLLRMIPSSSFRIERTGKLEGEPSILTVVWNGHRRKAGELPLLVFCSMRH